MPDTPLTHSDFVANFQIDQRPVRGRAVRMGPQSISPIVHRHDYPENLARILGEAVTLASLVGSSLKFDGRLLVQAEGDGPVKMLVGEYRTDGGVRGYARFDAEAWDNLDRINKGAAPHMPQLFGAAGRLGLIIIQDNPAIQPYQGIVPLVKGTLAECAEDYFAQSEQIETGIVMGVGLRDGKWRAQGLMLQRMPEEGGTASGNIEEDDWRRAMILMQSCKEDELLDPGLSAEDILTRLFHEEGVRVYDPRFLEKTCRCSFEKVEAVLKTMPEEDKQDMAEDGVITMTCEFCNQDYVFDL